MMGNLPMKSIKSEHTLSGWMHRTRLDSLIRLYEVFWRENLFLLFFFSHKNRG